MLKKSNVASIAPGNLYRHEGQLEYFKHNLLDLQNELEDELRLTRKYLKQEDLNDADLYDRASREINLTSELSKKKQKNLIYKIDQALESMEQGAYEFCIETEEPIGVERLEKRKA